MLSCGVSQGLPGFSSPDDKGNWTGPRRSISGRAGVAAAIFNDPTKIKFVPLSAKEPASRRCSPAKSTWLFAQIQPGRYPRDHHARRQF